MPTWCTFSQSAFSLFYGPLLSTPSVRRSLQDLIAVHYVVHRICDFAVPGLSRSDNRKPCAADGQAASWRPIRSGWRQTGRHGGSRWTDACWTGDRAATRNHRSKPPFISAPAAVNRTWSVAVDDHCSAGKSSSRPS